MHSLPVSLFSRLRVLVVPAAKMLHSFLKKNKNYIGLHRLKYGKLCFLLKEKRPPPNEKKGGTLCLQKKQGRKYPAREEAHQKAGGTKTNPSVSVRFSGKSVLFLVLLPHKEKRQHKQHKRHRHHYKHPNKHGWPPIR